MPKYQYQCKDCGEALEVQQSFTDDALTVCPHCGGDLRKVFNAVGVVFKGSGFYKTDSRSGSSSSSSTGSSSTGSSSTSGSSSATSSSSSEGGSSTSAAKADSTSSKPAKPSTSSNSGSGSAA